MMKNLAMMLVMLAVCACVNAALVVDDYDGYADNQAFLDARAPAWYPFPAGSATNKAALSLDTADGFNSDQSLHVTSQTSDSTKYAEVRFSPAYASRGGAALDLTGMDTLSVAVKKTADTESVTYGDYDLKIRLYTGDGGTSNYVQVWDDIISSSNIGTDWVVLNYDISGIDAVAKTNIQKMLFQFNTSSAGDLDMQIDSVQFVPEPATLGLLSMGSVFILKRRKARKA